ncbi:MAG: hypothetical protein IJW62_08875 [Clostridia bacterium]|nr:hypothetical protein [Clostridia bacterium]
MSYDLNLYLKAAPTLTPEAFAKTCRLFGLEAECCPGFTLDGTLFPLCAKFGKVLSDDPRSFLAAVEFSAMVTDEPIPIELSVPKKKWWQLKKPKGEEIVFPAGSSNLFFSCGIDSLEIPFALLMACAVAGEDGVLDDPQSGRYFVGQSAIAAEITRLLEEIRATPEDRLYLHEFEEWI